MTQFRITDGPGTRLVLAIFLAVLLAHPLGAEEFQSPPNATRPDAPPPLKVFILAGQSNMQGHAHVRTIDAMAHNPRTAPMLEEMRTAEGSPRVCERVWISSIGSAAEERKGPLTVGYGAEARGPKIGPEFTFGIYAEKLLDQPILIIKTAWGGKSVHTDFRPPSAGPYRFSESQRKELEKQGKDVEALQTERTQASGHNYRLMVDHVKKVLVNPGHVVPGYDPERGYELAGFVWFQGWNDMVDGSVYPDRNQPGGYDTYSVLLAQLIREVRRDLSAPKLPFVIGVMGVGGPIDQYPPEQERYKGVHQNFRKAMAAPAALPEFAGNVIAVPTAPYWDQEFAALAARERTIQPQIKAIEESVEKEKRTREEGDAAIDRLYGETFTARELVILKESTSNFEFHYLGSATIVAQIGKAFAEAVVGISKR